jgi:hypothetical protein
MASLTMQSIYLVFMARMEENENEMKTRYMNRIVREASEVELHPYSRYYRGSGLHVVF